VREVSDAGLVVRIECDGDLASVRPTAGLAMYRIVQESLANVARHTARAPAHVSIAVDDRCIRVEVSNPAVANGRAGAARDDRGIGLVVMRERVEALGGTLHTGIDGEQWRVCAVMPASGAS
jgi:signal transduction histidine kinase